MIKVLASSQDGIVSNSSFKFPGGEIQVQVGIIDRRPVTILAEMTCADDIIELMMTVDALRRIQDYPNNPLEIRLNCPYLPYARQDRVMEKGEALGVKVMCDIINSLGFMDVEVWDVHSDVALALLNNVKNYGPETFVQMIPVEKKNTILVAPDAGAIKKVFKVAKGLGFDMITASKHRSTKDGSITETEVHSGHVGDKDFLIVDDIGDGLRTFLELSKKLRPLTTGKIFLYVTHLIASKGLDICAGLIDRVYTVNPWPTVDLNHPLLTVLPTGE